MASPALSRRSKRFSIIADRILARFQSAAATAADAECIPHHDAAQLACVLDLHDAWCRFVAQLLFDSAAVKPTTGKGLVLARAPRCRTKGIVLNVLRDVRVKAIGVSNVAFGVRWSDVADVMRALEDLQVENARAVRDALSDGRAGAIYELTSLRNYMAHKNKNSVVRYRKLLRSLRLPESSEPNAVLAVRRGGILVFEQWVARLKIIAEASVQ